MSKCPKQLVFLSFECAGFLSIDCGSAQASYIDENNLEWVTDNETYMTIGQTFQQPAVDERARASRSFRYFPEPGRSKYCYELVLPNTTVWAPFKYLVRASFYMDASLLNTTRFSAFQFILSIDATNWFTVSSGTDENQTSLSVSQEGIFYPPGQVMSVCLQPLVGIPFISSLELRLLNDSDVYAYDGSNTQYLSKVFRYNFGAVFSSTPDVR